MTTQFPTHPERVLVVGDWHGNLTWARRVIDYAADQRVDTILHVGDFGYWVDSKATRDFLFGVNDALGFHNMTMAVVFGNHEAYDRLLGWEEPGRPITLLPDLNRIWHLPRGVRWDWWGQTFMALGGAHSVDRQARTAGRDWWPEEHLTEEQVLYACRPGPVGVIIAHDAPTGVSIPGVLPSDQEKRWPMHDLVVSELHRTLVRRVVDATDPVLLIHGHYHVGYRDTLNATTVVGLDFDGAARMSDHTLLLTPDTLHGLQKNATP